MIIDKLKKYCPRCGGLAIKKEMNPGACGDPECCGGSWDEDYCSKCDDTLGLCLNEIPKYDKLTGKKLNL